MAKPQSSFGLFLRPGGRPRRLTSVIQVGGPAPATAGSEALQSDDCLFEVFAFGPQLVPSHLRLRARASFIALTSTRLGHLHSDPLALRAPPFSLLVVDVPF